MRWSIVAIMLAGCGSVAEPGLKPGSAPLLGEPCDTPGALACNGLGQKMQLRCDGTWVENGTCPGALLCDPRTGPTLGTCQLAECADRSAGEVFCDGAVRRTCSDDLLTTTAVTCKSAAHCAAGTGSDCAVCLAGETMCTATEVRVCDAGGTSFVVKETCMTGTTCDPKTLTCTGPASVCMPGAYRCDGSNLDRCNVTGTGWDSVSVCVAPATCDVASKSCKTVVTPECTAGDKDCVGTTPRTCSSAGAWVDSAPCAGSTPICAAGACVGSEPLWPECTPGSTACIGDSSRRVCDATGHWTTVACSSGTSCAHEGHDCATGLFPGSRIVSDADAAKINGWAGLAAGHVWNRCYAWPEHPTEEWAARCNHLGPSVVVARAAVSGKVFGGYQSVSSGFPDGVADDSAAFLFSLTNGFKHPLLDHTKALRGYLDRGPMFGAGFSADAGHDLDVYFQAGACSALGTTYGCRVGSAGDATCLDDFCGGAPSVAVTLKDVEIWLQNTCEADVYACRGHRLEQCNSSGSAWSVTKTCAATEMCDVASKTCVPRDCTPGDKKCVGSTPQLCDATGRWQSQLACHGAKPTCSAGTCTGATSVCSGGTYQCSGRTLQKCNEATGVYETERGCANFLCDAAEGQCADCKPGQTECWDGFTVRTCGPTGHWSSPQGCGTGTSCVGDHCVSGTTLFPGSLLVTDKDATDINNWAGYTPTRTWTMCHSSLTSLISQWHSNCDGKGPTVTVTRAMSSVFPDKILGGYSAVAFDSGTAYRSDTKGFLFSLSNHAKHAVLLPDFASKASPTNGPIFGDTAFGTGDLTFSNGAIMGSCRGLGHTYACRVGAYDTEDCSTDLCGGGATWAVFYTRYLETWVPD